MADTLLSEQIFLSRDSIRELISTEVKRYLELENVDLTKSSFLSFLIDTISTLTGNLLFYQLSIYREFFLTKAQLPESILNLSSFLGYNTVEATPAIANVLLTFSFGFEDTDTQFVIPEGFKFNASGEVEFVTTYSTTISVTNNSTVSVVVVDQNKKYNLPIDIDSEGFSFILPLEQSNTQEQEFQIDSDIREFQFVTINVPITGEVASLEVQIQNPGSSSLTTWTEFNSLFLMTETDKGFVSKRTDTGRLLTFGNGLIGVQPEPGATVFVTIVTTSGSAGNVIAGSIKDGERIYLTTDAGATEIVNYEVVNTSSAFGGIDEESLEEIRRNSIASIRSLERLVTSGDYKDINVVEPNIPLAQNSLPILKRSDLQVNEIELFSALLFGTGSTIIDNLVPTRNAVFTFPLSRERILRDEIITIGDDQYYNIFEIELNQHNTVGEYEYVIASIVVIPALETSYSSSYSIYADSLEVERDGNLGVFKLHYKSDETDSELTTCEMTVKSSGSVKTMTNDSTAGYYIYTFNPFTDIPIGEQTFEFVIKEPGGDDISLYSNKVTFRDDLSTFMRSNIVLDSTSMNVYDVPVIEKEYYDSIDQEAFELQVLQELINSSDLSARRMLTDFSNIKFTNTYGLLNSMQLNEVTTSPVIDIVNTIPTGAAAGSRYIYVPNGRDDQYQDNIIRFQDSTTTPIIYQQPTADTILYVTSLGENYIYSEGGWIPLPTYSIPLEIEIELSKNGRYFDHKKIIKNIVDSKEDGLITQSLGTSFSDVNARYVKIRAVNIGQCPEWHKGAGHQAWLFADEIYISTK